MRAVLKLMLALSVLLCGAAAEAQNWPAKPIRIIVPYAPGGSQDTFARLIAQHLTERLGKQVFVENRGGAGGAIGTHEIAKAAPDGYTLGISGIGSHSILPAINPKVGYDGVRDFTHIAFLGGPPTALIVNPGLGVKTYAEFVALAKASARAMPFGSPGPGTHGHLIGAYFGQKAGIAVEHVAYKGAAPAMTDLVAGHIKLGFMTLGAAGPHIKSGSVQVLAVTADRRMPELPDVPTFKELGFPDLVAVTWVVVSGPANMSPDVVKRLNAEIGAILERPDIRGRLERDGTLVQKMDPAEVTAYVTAEVNRWGPIAKQIGVQME